MLSKLLIFGLITLCKYAFGDSSLDYNDVNSDGTFSFRHTNNDLGSFYHSASKAADEIVRGRYGSRNPSNGRVEETVYTAGPRGYRARGPQIHRKMDLAQYPGGPRGSPDDPLADPYDDPSYGFNFKTPEYERSENADASGRVKGLYSYLDDVGERHTVRYAAGAGTGYEVINAVPDSPASVVYSAPLYKAPAYTRGKMSVRRGPNGQYDFIASAPDHRRSETSGPDGIVRGSYSYLDDKGVQRTVQYIAGAGIGYRIVQNTVGPGTHLNPRPALPEYGVRDYQSNDLDESGYARPSGPGSVRPHSSHIGSGSGSNRPARPSRPVRPAGSSARPTRPIHRHDDQSSLHDRQDTDLNVSDDDINDLTSISPISPISRDRVSQGGGGIGGGSSAYPNRAAKRPGSVSRIHGNDATTDRGGYRYQGNKSERGGRPVSNDRDDENNYEDTSTHSSEDGYHYDKGTSRPPIGPSGKDEGYKYGPSSNRGSSSTISRTGNKGGSFNKKSTNYRGSTSFSSSNVYDDDDYNRIPLVTSDHGQLDIDRNRDWSLRSRDSTVIKNVGKWYINLPPGQAVRAHVQNIDILPLGGRIPSPSEALRQDELNN